MHFLCQKYVCFFAGRPAQGHFALWLSGICLVLSQWMAACQPPAPASSRPVVVATTGIIADLLKNIAGDDFEIKALMGPGVDPHLYKATRQDLADLRRAEVIFYNGLHLEGKMAEVLEKLESKHAVFALAKGIAPQKIRKQGGASRPAHLV
ncbi:MAG: zinc ABC transporter solute-binding protein [Microscillaceae bacterium]|nr:zinc ABC transporter solute-binding protein [Microscillaceae bacterium]